MASPAATAPSPNKGGAGSVAPVSRTLDCSSCFEPFSPEVGPRYPRILTPCAHTFCTACIEKQLQARPNDFRCLLHDQAVAISKAEDAKANFALIELLELIAKDADHQVVDERTKPPSCSECDEPATCYCKNDDACYCDAHRASEHCGKARSSHVIVPVAERSIAVPKCSTHKSKDLDLWCTQCSMLCCVMCERSGTHKAHADKLAPVDDVVISQRDQIAKMTQEAKDLTVDKLDKDAQTLLTLRTDFELAARRVQEEITKEEAEMICAVQARYAELRQEAQKQLANGLKHIDLRVDDLTLHRSRTAIVPEEAARVLRMSDYALLSHVNSVKHHMDRARKGWEEYQLNSHHPQPVDLTYSPKLLLNEIAATVDAQRTAQACPLGSSCTAFHSAQSQIKQLQKQCAESEQKHANPFGPVPPPQPVVGGCTVAFASCQHCGAQPQRESVWIRQDITGTWVGACAGAGAFAGQHVSTLPASQQPASMFAPSPPNAFGVSHPASSNPFGAANAFAIGAASQPSPFGAQPNSFAAAAAPPFGAFGQPTSPSHFRKFRG